jgi:ribosomal protein S15
MDKKNTFICLILNNYHYLCSRILQNNKLLIKSSMYLDQAKKQEIFGQYGKSNTDTGSAESQIALFSYRISHLTEHLKKNRKDYTTARSLTKLVGKRRALLDYLYDRDIERYRAIIKALGLRR